MRFIITISILATIKNANAILLPQKSTQRFDTILSECIANISTTYFRKDLPLLVQTPQTYYFQKIIKENQPEIYINENKILEALKKNSHVGLVVAGHQEKLKPIEDNVVKPGAYLLMLTWDLRYKNDLVHYMMRRIKSKSRNQRAPLIFVDKTVDPLNISNFILAIALKFGYTNAIVLTLTPRGKIYVSGWIPKKQKYLCSEWLVIPRILDLWIGKENKFKDNNNLFPSNNFADIKKCTLKVGYADMWSLMLPDTMYLNRLMTKVRYNVAESDFRGADIIYPIWYTKAAIPEECRFTYPFSGGELTWYVPTGVTVPRWKRIFKTFNPITWLLAVTAFILGSFISWLLERRNSYRSFAKTLMNALLSHLSVGLMYNFRGKGVVAVSFFSLWLFYCLHINTLYQAALFGFLVNPGIIPPIATFKELQESGLEMYTLIEYNRVLKISRDEYRNLSLCPDEFDRCLERIHKNRDIGLLADRGYVDCFGPLSAEGKLFMVPLQDNRYLVLIGFGIKSRLGCILHTEFENTVKRYVEGGFLVQSILRIKKGIEMRRTLNDTMDKVFSFSLLHLEGSFYLYLFDLLSAVLAFVLEILRYKIVVCVYFIDKNPIINVQMEVFAGFPSLYKVNTRSGTPPRQQIDGQE